MTSPEEIKLRLEGPVNSIPTPFIERGDLDWEGIRNIIEVGIAGGSEVSLLTYGDSQLEFLSDDEVIELTSCLIETVDGRALTVAATRRWPDSRMVSFAEFCKGLGVDVLMVLPSEHASPKGKVIQYSRIAEVMPVMLVGYPPYEILDELTDVPNICCFKEDGTIEYGAETMRRYSDRWKFMTGGGLWRNYTQWPWSPAFFCFFSSFAPHIAERYWTACRNLNATDACKIIRDIENPFTALASTFGGGFQALWRATMALNGVSARFLRAPLISASEAEMEKLHPELENLGLITNPLG